MVEVENLNYIESEGEGISFTVGGVGIHGIYCIDAEEKDFIFDCLCGATDTYRGSVLVGKNSAEFNPLYAKAKIGCVLCDMPFYEDMTVYETLSFVGTAKKISPEKCTRQIKEALSLLGIEKLENKLVSNLSVAKRRRLAVAQSLLGNPDMIVFDGLTEGVNDSCSKDLIDIVRMLGKMKSVIIVSNNDAFLLDLCEDIVGICNGRTEFSQTTEELTVMLDGARVISVLLKGDASAAAEAVRRLDGVSAVSVDDETVRVECNSGASLREEILTACESADCRIRSVSMSAVSLSSLFKNKGEEV